MSDFDIESFRNFQQANIIAAIEKSIEEADFEWAFDLYCIFLVLFSGKYNLALVTVFQTLHDRKIENSEFQRNIIGFTLEKTIYAEPVNDRISAAVLELINQNLDQVAKNIQKAVSKIESEDIFPGNDIQFSKKIDDLIFNEIESEFDRNYSDNNWIKTFRSYEKLQTIFPTINLQYLEEKLFIAWGNLSKEISIMIGGKKVTERIFLNIKNGIKFLIHCNEPGEIEIDTPIGSLTHTITDIDILYQRKKVSFGIPLEQERPTVKVEKDVLMMEVYPGKEEAKIVLTLKTESNVS